MTRSRSFYHLAARGFAAVALMLTAACGDSGTTPAPPPGTQRLEGTYMGLRENMTTGGVSTDFFTFLPDGRVFRSFPAEGFARPVDWATQCFYKECGTFQHSGSEVRLDLNTGRKILSLDGEGALHEDGKGSGYRPVHPLDGVKPNATYGYLNAQGDTIVAVTFTSEGRFRERRLLQHTGWTEWGPDSQTRRQVPTSGSGAYTISRGTLELRYDDGRTAYLMVMLLPGVQPTPVPGSIYFNNSDITRLP